MRIVYRKIYLLLLLTRRRRRRRHRCIKSVSCYCFQTKVEKNTERMLCSVAKLLLSTSLITTPALLFHSLPLLHLFRVIMYVCWCACMLVCL